MHNEGGFGLGRALRDARLANDQQSTGNLKKLTFKTFDLRSNIVICSVLLNVTYKTDLRYRLLRQIHWYKLTRRLSDHNLEDLVQWSSDITTKYGLPKLELRRVCKEVFSKNVAMVTIEISEDSVTATKRDFKATFPEKLSIISELAQSPLDLLSKSLF